MEFAHPEVKYLASRVYAQDLVLRLICARMPEAERQGLLASVTAYRDLMLNEAVPDMQAEAVAAYAERIIAGAPDRAAGR